MTQDELNELATKMEERFTPHAVNCTDEGCGPNLLNNNDWSRYYAMEDIAAWLRRGAPGA